jgi:flagellar biosynthesis protein FlhF
MKIKSYFAVSVESAVRQARQELGPEAMLMNSRKAPPEARHLGEYEVVFACPPEEGAAPSESQKPARTDSPAAFRLPDLGTDRLGEEIAELRRQVERMAESFGRARTVASSNLLASPMLVRIFSGLIANDVDAGVANSIVSALRTRGDSIRPEALRLALLDEIGSLCPVEPALGCNAGAGRRIVALVGPPGAGKTTTLVKLAVKYGLNERKPTQLLTLDLERIAAADQLHTFAAILGVGFQTLETTHALATALDENKNKDLILIDTPGYGQKDMENAGPLARFLASHDEIDVHLVLSASMKAVDLAAVVDRFSIFRPRRLLFTRLDETQTFGPILNETARSGWPVSFLCSGQQIPEDLEPATRERLVSLLVGELVGGAAAAAA